jgi:chromosome partitioning protein
LVLVSSNRKGGCGKTSTVFHLGGELARRNQRVLLIDCDPQASLSQSFLGSRPVEDLDPGQSVVALFDDRLDPNPSSIIHRTAFDTIHLVPACEPLTSFNHPDPPRHGWLQDSLRQFVAEVGGNYDVVICDTPPNLQLLTWAALVVADLCVTPVVPEDYAAQGIIHVRRFIEEVQRTRNGELRWLGLLICMMQPRLGIHKVYEQVMRDAYGDLVLSTIVPHQTIYKEAVSLKTPVSIHKPKNAAAKTMAALADELQLASTRFLKEAA